MKLYRKSIRGNYLGIGTFLHIQLQHCDDAAVFYENTETMLMNFTRVELPYYLFYG